MRATIDRIVAADRFSMPALYSAVWPLIERHPLVSPHVPAVREALAEAYESVTRAILRHAFLIEVVKVPKIETTKVRTRWFDELEADQRWCPLEECVAIAADLLGTLAPGWLDDRANAGALSLFLSFPILSYEAPIDYRERPAISDSTTRIHRHGNLGWTCCETMLRTLKLRKHLTSTSMSPDAGFFRAVLNEKIKTKAYLTDRVLTGDHKTNREKRWEVHPHSVHFALRRTCMEIEYVLLTQLCAFDGFPEASRRALQAEGILPEPLDTFCCPITLDPMSFESFRDELANPTHGKSSFQVGHLNPLKLDDPASAVAGHTAANASWVSAHGNRVQGSMSLSEVRELIRRIAANYEARGLV